MRPLVALGLAVPLLAAASCRSPGGLDVSKASLPVIDPSTVEPRLREDFDALRDAVEAGADSRAREIAARIEGSNPGASDAALVTAVRSGLDARVDPRVEPSLYAIGAALEGGDVESARAILERVRLLGVFGRTRELFDVYERILVGRALVAELDLSVRLTLDSAGSDRSGGATLSIALHARRASEGTCELRPGPATLRLRARSLDARGNLSSSFDTRAFDDLRLLALSSDAHEIVLSSVPVVIPRGALALELTGDLELVAGSIVEDGRRLPAMRIEVAPGVAVLTSAALSGEPSNVDEICAEALGEARERVVIDLALRLPPSERRATLDRLATRVAVLGETRLARLAPALSWLAPDVHHGRDATAWRRFLEQRVAAPSGTRPKLVLPRAGT